MTTTRQFKTIMKKIHGVKPGQTAKLPLLLSELNNESAAIRAAAVSALAQCFNLSGYEQVLISMVDTDEDQDVVIALMSALSSQNRGSRNFELARQFIRAVGRFDPCLGGTREALTDSLLRLIDNLDSAVIWKMGADERDKRIADIRAELDRSRSDATNTNGVPHER